MPFDCTPQRPDDDPDNDKWFSRWLGANLTLREIVQLYVGMGRLLPDGQVVLCRPRPRPPS